MSTIRPNLILKCRHCEVRPPPGSDLEAFQMHMQVYHNMDEVELELVALCICGKTMTVDPDGSRRITNRPNMIADHWTCICGNDTWVKRKIE